MTIVVTRNVRERFRGFLSSVMCEVAAGVYTAPRMSVGVRDRVWTILESWWQLGDEASIVMTWPDSRLPGGQVVRVLGENAHREMVNYDGVYLARTALSDAELQRLLTEPA